MATRGRRGAVATLGALLAALLGGACSHAWDALEPTSAASSGAGGSGGAGSAATSTGHGGATSSSTASTSSTSSTTTTSTTSSSGTGGGGPTHCAGTNLLSWDFSAEQSDVFGMDQEVQLTGGVIVLPLPNNAPDWDSVDATTHRYYDLRGDRVYIEATQVPTGKAYGGLELDYDNGDDLFIGVSQGTLECGFDRDGSQSLPVQLPYDPVQHRHWQLREQGGAIHCETSPDGSSWTDQGSFDLAASLFEPPSGVRIQLLAISPPQTPNPGSFRVDNLNGALPSAGSWCDALSYSDDFSSAAAAPGPAWYRSWAYGDAASFDQAGDKLNFHFGNTDSNNLGYQSSGAYDMTGQRVTLQVVALPAYSDGEGYFIAGNDDDNDVFWSISQDGFDCGYDAKGSSQTIWSGQAPALPVWLGIRESGGKFYCEIFEGGAWKSYGFAPGVMDPKSVDVVMGAYTQQGSMPGGSGATYDGYNLAPVP